MILADFKEDSFKRLDKLGLGENKEYVHRLNEEMKVFALQFTDYKKSPVDYFVELSEKAKKDGKIPNSNNLLTSYIWEITDEDPLKTKKEIIKTKSAEFPDIDMDFEDARRDLAKEYLIEKYGQENVASICAFGKMKAKSVIKDIGRTKGIDPEETNDVTKTMGVDDDLRESNRDNAVVKAFFDRYEYMDLIGLCDKLVGNVRHLSQHAAGVVIAPSNIMNYCGLERANKKIVTCWEESGGSAELSKAGIIKFDLLGLNTLTVIKDTLKGIKKNYDKDIDIENIDLQDKAVLKGFYDANTIGIFQFERGWIRNQLKKIKITTFEDVAAVNALNRPGPLKNGDDEKFYKTKNRIIELAYLHPRLEPHLKETYGVILYQEQCMRIAQDLAGFSEEDADNFRKIAAKGKAMIAKGINPFEKWEKRFLSGCRKNGVNGKVKAYKTVMSKEELPTTAENVKVLDKFTDENGNVVRKVVCDVEVGDEIFNQIKSFAEYGFPKAHAVEYAMISVMGMYLKHYYPIEFMSSLLSNTPNAINQAEKTNKFVDYFFEARRMGIKNFPPNINKSEIKFTPTKEGILGGFGFIKNLGEKAIEEIIEKRPFANFGDFMMKVNGRKVNKSSIFALVHSGCFDEFIGIEKRSDITKRYELLHDYVVFKKAQNKIDLPYEPTPVDAVMEEGEACGDQIYNTLLDLVDYKGLNSEYEVDDQIMPFSSIEKINVGTKVRVVGVVGSFVIKSNNNTGNKYAFLTIKNGAKNQRIMLWQSEVRKIQSNPEYSDALKTKNVITLRVKRDKDYHSQKTFIGEVEGLKKLI